MLTNDSSLSNISEGVSDVGSSLVPVQEFTGWFATSLPAIQKSSSQLNTTLTAAVPSIVMLFISAEEIGKEVDFSVDNLTRKQWTFFFAKQPKKAGCTLFFFKEGKEFKFHNSLYLF